MASLFNSEQIAEYKEAFLLFDKANQGYISVNQIGTIMRTLGQNIQENHIEQLIIEFGLKNDGILNFEDFLTLISKYIKFSQDQEQQYEKCLTNFQVFDSEGNGFVKIEHFRQIVDQFLNEFQLTKEEVEEYILQDVKDGNGVINYKDFIQIMKFNS